ncbi:MAG: GntR family transcriptional regulator [Roseivivax sp.]|nr:GntR family transcriptional regulator [Roseivivax sp.]
MIIAHDAAARLDPTGAVAPQLYRLLREAIIQGEMEPGTRISESEIATRYAVSRQPVREAFIKLAEDGLLEVRPQRGTFVCKISVDSVMDARFVREAIEADIVKALAADPDAALVRDLMAQIEEQRVVAGRDSVAFIRLDERFHRTLAEGAGRSHAWRVVEGQKVQMDRVRHLATRRFPMAALVEQHGAIVHAIGRGDIAGAEQAMRLHLRAILTDLPEVVRDLPNFFEAARTPGRLY